MIEILYRVWFYFLVAVPIIALLPLLVIFTLSEKTYPQFFWLARNIWSRFILLGMFCPPKITYQQSLEKGVNYMLVANHTSMLDIMLMFLVSKNPFVFVGKKELAKIPVFGFFYKRVCVLVDRDDLGSRIGVYRKAERRLNQGLSICIFPEGGVPDEAVVLDKFKDGAFKMAIAHQIPVVPMTFLDCKKRFPFGFTKGGPGSLRAKVYRFIYTKGMGKSDIKPLETRVRKMILNELKKDQ